MFVTHNLTRQNKTAGRQFETVYVIKHKRSAPAPANVQVNRGTSTKIHGGGEGNRTPDTGIFSPLLYQLSYPAKMPALASLYILTKDMPLSTLYSDETLIF